MGIQCLQLWKKNFGLLKDKTVTTSSRETLDLITYFDIISTNRKNINQITKIALAFEIKCEDAVEQSLKEARKELIQ